MVDKFLKEDGEYIAIPTDGDIKFSSNTKIMNDKLDKILYEIELLKSEVDYLNRATVGEGCVCSGEY